MINTSALRQSILNLATSGQLSERRSGDTPTEAIEINLPPLTARRKKLLSQTVSMDQTGNVPSHWIWLKLGEISSYGDTPEKKRPADIADETWMLELEDIENGGRLRVKKRAAERATKGEKTVFRNGQVLYSKLRPYLKKILVADEDGVSTPELVAFDVFCGINPTYITYCLSNSYTDRAIEKRSYGIKMPRIDPAFMANLPIPIPPIEEQQRIVDIVSEAFKELQLIDEIQAHFGADAQILKRRIIDLGICGNLTMQNAEDGTATELLEAIEIKKSQLQAAGIIRKGKTPREIAKKDIPFEIPETWAWVRFSALSFGTYTGPFGSALHKSDYVDQGIPVINPANIVNGRAVAGKMVSDSTRDRLASYVLRTGDLVIGRRGEMGRTAIITEHEDGWLCGTGCFFSRVSEYVIPEYWQLLFSSTCVITQLEAKSVGTTMTNLNLTILGNTMIPLPPVQEQGRIVERVKELLYSLP